ncbi:DUF2628 domain-containing protein [Streptococcus suis]|uniref:DUF2628 domain-containing protein n=1 Tax=Streptococcus suis TaxID=1307 RepID=A0AAD0KWH5_STRSU|nr:hypothetical protein [Streptococcus suis]AWX95582.1 hypothetical protein BKM66_05300 [Streptococcus suis]AWX97531.1 hypothetical protein BKM67_05585 [Streptococcus suis]MBS8055285.1 DUF2628 domain-containing protein [Streptococcus suis]MBS8070300.1 DUF2628 domain-containing protein [Streptococcus suis]MBS8094172.1 DUF2628 domain-containing protein [Streptococcus suis]
MKVHLVDEFGNVKEVKAGFSWTTFFFKFFVPLIRGDLKWFAIILVAFLFALLIDRRFDIPFINTGFGILWGYLYNRIYIKEALVKGWRPVSEADQEAIRQFLQS